MGVIFVLIGLLVLGFILLGIYAKVDSDVFAFSGSVLCVLAGASLVVLGIGAIFTNLTADAAFASYQVEHDAYVYQLENNLYENDNDFGLKELYTNITDYNKMVTEGRINKDNKWISVFYPLDYDSLEIIKLPEK